MSYKRHFRSHNYESDCHEICGTDSRSRGGNFDFNDPHDLSFCTTLWTLQIFHPPTRKSLKIYTCCFLHPSLLK